MFLSVGILCLQRILKFGDPRAAVRSLVFILKVIEQDSVKGDVG